MFSVSVVIFFILSIVIIHDLENQQRKNHSDARKIKNNLTDSTYEWCFQSSMNESKRYSKKNTITHWTWERMQE